MPRAIEAAFVAVTVICVAGSTVGCSLIGYAVGGAIDRTRYDLDSVSVTKQVDSAGVEHRSLQGEQLRTLVKEASPGEGSIVEVLTQKGSFKGDALTLDTVLGLKREPEQSGREDVLPGDQVDLTIRDSGLTHISGRVQQLTEKSLLLRVYGDVHSFPFNIVNAMFTYSGRVLSYADLASPNFSRRLIRVPVLVVGQESPPLFIPLRDVEKIRVARPVYHWGPARIILVVVGGVIDLILITRPPHSKWGLS